MRYMFTARHRTRLQGTAACVTARTCRANPLVVSHFSPGLAIEAGAEVMIDPHKYPFLVSGESAETESPCAPTLLSAEICVVCFAGRSVPLLSILLL